MFLSDFSKCSGTSYNKANQRDRSGIKASLYGIRKCIHNVCTKNKKYDNALNKNGNKTGKAREPGKNTKCDAEIKFSIAAPCMADCNHTNMNTHNLKKDYPIFTADALRYRPASEETKKLSIEVHTEEFSINLIPTMTQMLSILC